MVRTVVPLGVVGQIRMISGELLVIELRPNAAECSVFDPARSCHGLPRAHFGLTKLLLLGKAAVGHLYWVAYPIVLLQPRQFSRIYHAS
jgi:hypothetical protein